LLGWLIARLIAWLIAWLIARLAQKKEQGAVPCSSLFICPRPRLFFFFEAAAVARARDCFPPKTWTAQ
jgi:hypothetical protein